MRLKGKTAIITGAATGIQGSIMGFGGASAWQFLKEGARVVITDINVESGVRTATQMQEAGFDAAFMEHDVTVSSDWERILNATFELFGTLEFCNLGCAERAHCCNHIAGLNGFAIGCGDVPQTSLLVEY